MKTEATGDARAYRAVLENSFRGRYESGRDSWTKEEAMAVPARLLLEALGGRRGRVLDVGAGSGRDLEVFLAAGHRAAGVDLFEAPEWGPLRARWGGAVELTACSFLDYAPAGTFTAALDNGCFHHQHPDHYQAYLERMRALLEPGAPALFSVGAPLAGDEAGKLTLADGGRINQEFSEAELRARLERAGFSVAGSRRIPRAAYTRDYLAVLARRSD